MVQVLGVLAFVFGLLLAFGGLTGRVRLRGGCCSVADPRRDLRMRGAFEDERVGPQD